MGSAGYIKLYRSLQDHWLFRERRSFSRFEAWVDLLFLASFTGRGVFLRGHLYAVKRGDVLWSQRELARRWLWSEKKLRGFLEMLERNGQIQTQTLPQLVTQISICNYDIYQGEGRTEDSATDLREDALRAHESRRTKKGKKGKKDISPLDLENAERIYLHYAAKVKPGARADAIKSIGKLLTEFSPEALIACVDRYAGNGMSPDVQFRVQANNFFGIKARFRDYISATSPVPPASTHPSHQKLA